MNTRQALNGSLKLTPPTKTRAEVMAELREQAATQIEMAAKFWVDGELEDCARSCSYVHSALTAYLENAKEEDMSQATVREASSEALAAELRRRARQEKDEVAAQALKLKPLPASKDKPHGR